MCVDTEINLLPVKYYTTNCKYTQYSQQSLIQSFIYKYQELSLANNTK